MPAPKATTKPEDPQAPDEAEVEAEEVDLDLDDLDPALREALAEPTTVRLSGKVISIPPMADWPHLAQRLLTLSAYDAWAESVLSEDDAKVFKAAELHNYQVETIMKLVTATAGTTPGKSSRSASSRRNGRRK